MPDSNFVLDPRLKNDCVILGNLNLCQVLLNADANYPWLILVPRREGLREIFQLDNRDQQQFWKESNAVSLVMMGLFRGDKLNVAALGNVVAQLHIHHIVRFELDPAWPQPVWGAVPRVAYAPEILQERINLLQRGLSECGQRFLPA